MGALLDFHSVPTFNIGLMLIKVQCQLVLNLICLELIGFQTQTSQRVP